MSNLKSQISKKGIILFWSVLQSFWVTVAMSVQYVIPKSSLSNTFANQIDCLQEFLDGYGFIWSGITILLALFFHYTNTKIQDKNDLSALLYLISIVFGILNVCGLMMFYLDNLPFFENKSWLLIALFLFGGWAILFFYVARWVLYGFKQIFEWKQVENFGLEKKNVWLFAGIIFLCWLPWMIVYYPASIDWDAHRQLCSVLGYGTFAKSNHDPWLASCIITCFYKLGVAFGSPNLGIFLFVFTRNIVISLIYSNCVVQLCRAGIPKKLCVGALLFYAVTPVWGAYAKHAFKDTFATALFAAYFVSLITVVIQGKGKKLRWKSCVSYVFFAAAAALMRNNFIYAIAPVTFVLVLWLLFEKLGWKKSVVLLLGIFIYLGFNQYIFNVVGVRKGSSREALSVPFQQTARTVKYHGEEISEEQRAVIDSVLDYSSMAEKYDPILSDPIKNTYKETGLGAYFVTWFKMMFQFPDTYIEAAVGGSYGYYAFTPKHTIPAGNWNSGMTVLPGINSSFEKYGLKFSFIEDFGAMRDILYKWHLVWDSLPVLSLTDTIAAYTWTIILLGYWLLRKKKFPELIVIFAMLIMILTCIASPVNDAFRYYSPIAAGFPALVLLCRNRTNTEEKEVVKNG